MHTKNSRFLAVIISILLFTACGGRGGGTTTPPPDGTPPVGNQPPTVEITESDPVMELTAVTLSATAKDADGDGLAFSWTQTGGTPVEFSGAETTAITFSAPKVQDSETLSFAVDVNDGEGHSVTDDIDLLVTEGEIIVMLASVSQNNALEAFRLHATDTGPVHLDAPLPIVENGFIDASNLQISPDRKHVAWFADNDMDERYELMVAETFDGTGARSLTPNLDAVANERVLGFEWAPNSQSILYKIRKNGAGHSLFVVPTNSENGSDARRVSGDNSGDATIWSFAWSPDSTQIAFTGDAVGSTFTNAYLVDAASFDGNDRRNVSDEIVTPGDTGKILAWSPNKEAMQLVFLHGAGPDYGLYTVSTMDGSIPVQWVDGSTFSVLDSSSPEFSPDGAYVAFRGIPATDPDKSELYVIKSDGTDLRRVSGDTLTTYALGNFKWSPDSKSLAFVGDLETPDARELFVVSRTSADGNDRRKVSGIRPDSSVPPDGIGDGEVNSSQFYWSPDSKQLAFNADDIARQIRTDVFIVSATGDGSDRRWVSGAATDFDSDGRTDSRFRDPQWSRDGSHLYFTGDVSRRDLPELFKVTADTADGSDRTSVSGVPIAEFGYVSEFHVGGEATDGGLAN